MCIDDDDDDDSDDEVTLLKYNLEFDKYVLF